MSLLELQNEFYDAYQTYCVMQKNASKVLHLLSYLAEELTSTLRAVFLSDLRLPSNFQRALAIQLQKQSSLSQPLLVHDAQLLPQLLQPSWLHMLRGDLRLVAQSDQLRQRVLRDRQHHLTRGLADVTS